MSTDIKLSIKLNIKLQPFGFLDALSAKLAGSLMKVDVLLVTNVLATLVTMASSSAIDRDFQREMLGKGEISRKNVVKSRKDVVRARGRYNKMEKKNLFLLHFLGNIKITKYFNYEYRFNGVCSRENLPRIKRWSVYHKSWLRAT